MKAYTGSAGSLWPSRTLTPVRSASSATAEEEKPDTARRVRGDSTTSGQINRSIILRHSGRITALVNQNGLRADPPGSSTETVGSSKSTFWPFLAYGLWFHQARTRGTGLVSCTGGPAFSEEYAAGPPNTHRRLGAVGL